MDIGTNVELLSSEISWLISEPQGPHMHLLSDPYIDSTFILFSYLVDPVNPVNIEKPRDISRMRFEEYLESTSQGAGSEEARKDDHIRGRSHAQGVMKYPG